MGTCESSQTSVTSLPDLQQKPDQKRCCQRLEDELPTEGTSAATSGNSISAEKSGKDERGGIIGNYQDGCHRYQAEHAKYVFSELDRMRRRGECTDFDIACNGCVFHFHRLVLSANSDSLKLQFSPPAGNPSVLEFNGSIFEGIDSVTMETLSSFMYADGVTLTEEKLQQIQRDYQTLQSLASFKTSIQPSVMHSSVTSGNAPFLISQIERFQKERFLTDLDLYVDTQKFECHRCILAACSGYFRHLFTSNREGTKDRIVRVREVSPDVIGLLVNFAYTGVIPIDEGNVPEILAASRRFQFKEVEKLCLSFLNCKLSLGNCITIMRLAAKENAMGLAERAKQLAVTQFEDLAKQPGFLRLSLAELKSILVDELHVDSEERVCDAIMKWIDFSRSERSEHAAEILEYVNVDLLSNHYVQSKLLKDCVTKKIVQKQGYQKKKYIKTNKHPRKYTESVIFLGESSQKKFHTVIYDPLKKTWTEIPEFQHLPLDEVTSSISGVLFWQGELWIVLGWRHHVIFNLNEREWYTNSCISGRFRSKFGFVSVSEKVYVLGGESASNQLQRPGGPEFLLDVYKYNSSRDIWEFAAPLLGPILPKSSIVCNDKIYVISVINHSSSIRGYLYHYNHGSDSWALAASLPEDCFPDEEMSGSSSVCDVSVTSIDASLYIYVGNTGSFHRYDTQRNMWYSLPTMNKLRKGHQAVVCLGRIMVFGGFDIASESPVTEIEAFDPLPEEWEIVDEISRDFPLKRLEAAVTVPNKQLWRTYLT